MPGDVVSAFGLGVPAEGGADDLGSQSIAAGSVERLAAVDLQVGRQREHKEAIDGRNGKAACLVGVVACAAERAKLLDGGRGSPHVFVHVDPQAQVAEQEQGFLRADQVGVLQ